MELIARTLTGTATDTPHSEDEEHDLEVIEEYGGDDGARTRFARFGLVWPRRTWFIFIEMAGANFVLTRAHCANARNSPKMLGKGSQMVAL